MKKIVLTTEQEAWLRRELKQPATVQTYRRAAALIAVHEGRGVSEIAAVLGVTRQTIHNWILNYAAASAGSLLEDAPRSGRPSVWNQDCDKLIREALATAPANFGYSEHVWTGKLIARHLQQILGRNLSQETARRRLRTLGYAWCKGRYTLISQASEPLQEAACEHAVCIENSNAIAA